MASSLISGSNPPKYDVFLSFRGEDTRNTFTSHLYAALCRSKIETFMDDREVTTGDEISSSLLIAIRSSSLSIIIFSKDYASSSWCLNELLEILECHKTRGHIILPIFYHVIPSKIRKQTGTYVEAFAIHEERFKETDKVQKWRTALADVTGIVGTVIENDRPEPEYIDKIVEDVSCRLKLTSSGDYLDPGLVGITSRIKRVKSLLCIGMKDFRIIGIWGMGGIGKSTIAKAIFHRIAERFEAVCILADVKNEAKRGLQHLQELPLFKIFGKQNLNMDSFIVGKLRRKKILIVLDDVDDWKHLKVLVDPNLFGLGSRIIITSRDRKVLHNISGDKITLFKVEGLNHREALQLFSENAFKQSFSPEVYMDLARKVVSYCGANPLALQVLGGSLYGEDMPQWNSLLDKLKKCPNPEIQAVLRISYDGLDDDEKEIFLFIACFFKECFLIEEDLDRVINILNGCEYSTEIGINRLRDKCLLTITNNRIMMHDLIQEMGRGIVIQESPKESGKRSRLWDPQDICYLFEKYKGTSEVESISLDLSQISELCLSPDAFTRMPRLKLLKFYGIWHKEMNKVKIREGVLESLPEDLRYLCWHGYPSKSLPSNFNPNLLVELDMSYSNLQYLWKDTKDLGNLRRISLQGCKQLIEVPDLSRAPKLHVMNLDGCSNLTKFSKISRNVKELYLSKTAVEEIPSLRHLTSLETLDLSGNTRLKNLPTGMIHLTSLEILRLDGCSNITKFPQISWAITKLYLGGVDIEEVPDSVIKSLNKLVKLDLCGNTRLKNLPSMSHLTSLSSLNLKGCSNITEFPEVSVETEELHLSGTVIDEVPNSAIESLYNLVILDISDNTRLKNLPSMSHLTSLSSLNLKDCSNITEFPEVSVNTGELYLCRTAIEEIPSFAERFTKLEYLTFSHCRSLKRVSSDILKLTMEDFPNLDFSGCSKLENLPEVLEDNRKIVDLCFDWSGIKTLPSSIEIMSGLSELSLRYCKNLESLPNSLCNLTNLVSLDLSGCVGVEKMLENVSSSSGLCSLSELDLSECDMLVFPSALSCLSSLDVLRLRGNNFDSLSLKHFTSLRHLDISCCERLKYLQEFPLPSRLESVNASHCISLETLPDITVVSTGEEDINQDFMYYNCLKLDVKAIQTDVQKRIQLMANKETTSKIRRKLWGHWPKFSFCFSGSEIPEWVSYQNDQGSSLTIDLPPHWYNNNFFRLVLCFVASCDSSDENYSEVDCKCNFMDSDLENICDMKFSHGRRTWEHLKSDHVFVKYYESGEDDSGLSSRYSLCQKVRFQFSHTKECCKVKSLGFI
ncbi:hypothetical protein Dsin_027519 [Dipteronia sinensis]|uniref:ADP-ribosyl cyclase/cyclic ADP-ribose hydrolase n=1 Tax=Dipteronia sinensis TaxID=43782 RepID=A0AAE0DTD4_9ROSI|nr:hypothetical protein Dsin_027519 [Dipteronia sinensis]